MKYLTAMSISVCIFFSNVKAQDSAMSMSNSMSSSDTMMTHNSSSQTNLSSSNSSFNAKDVYRITWKADAPITGAGLGLSVLGLHFIQTKDDLSDAEANSKSRSDIPKFDRGNAGFYSQSANDNSYYPFFASFATPVLFVIADKTERQQAGKILVMYTESLAITSTLYTLSAGLIDRSRPLVYPNKDGNFKADLSKRTSNNSQRSFYAGHVAASASASFFAAKVFSDLHPDSKLKPYVWVVCAALPAVTAYYRYEAGEHFLSDCILGYGLGAAVGILVPQFHKTKNMDRISIAPAIWQDSKGISLTYTLR